VRGRVASDYARVRRERANELLLESLSTEYDVNVDTAAIRSRSLEAMRKAVE
jgi:hypothetical protein